MKKIIFALCMLSALLSLCAGAFATQIPNGSDLGTLTENLSTITCTHSMGWENQGTEGHKCMQCGQTASHEIVPKVTKPTCSGVGYTMDSCSLCDYTGAQYDIVPASDNAHAWGVWITAQESTCSVQGSRSHTCTLCGKDETEKMPLAGHKWKVKIIAPTCIADGYTLQVCSVCGAEGEKTDVVPRSAAYHNWGEFIVTEQPDCENAGSKQRVCVTCEATHRQEIPEIGHHAKKITVPAETCKDGYDVDVCKACGVEMSDRVNFVPAKHTYGEWTVTIEPLCESEGEQARACSLCGKEEKQLLPAAGHDFKEGTRLPTCASDGYTAIVCARCGLMQGEKYDIVPAGPEYHEWNEDRWKKESEPTCTEWGQYWQGCRYCEYMRSVPIMPKGHVSEEHVVAQSFAQDGYKVLLCSVCGGEDGARYDIVPAGMYSAEMTETQVSDREFVGAESAVLYTARSESGEKAAVLELRADASGMLDVDFSEEWFAQNSVVRVEIIFGGVRLNVQAEGKLHAEVACETAQEGLLVTVLTNLPTDGFDETAGEYERGMYMAPLTQDGENRFDSRCMRLTVPAGPGTLLVVSAYPAQE